MIFLEQLSGSKLVLSSRFELGLIEFTGMPCGLCNAVVTFERLIETLFDGYTCTFSSYI